MAKGISKKQLFFAYKNFYGFFFPSNDKKLIYKIIIFFLKKIYPIVRIAINLINSILFFFSKSDLNQNYENKITTKDFSVYHSHLSEHGWCFIENFFDEETHKNLLKTWPSKRHFKLKGKPTKYYSTAFLSKSKPDEKKFHNFTYFKKIYEYLFGNEFKLNVSKLIDNNNLLKFSCYSILSGISGFKNTRVSCIR